MKSKEHPLSEHLHNTSLSIAADEQRRAGRLAELDDRSRSSMIRVALKKGF